MLPERRLTNQDLEALVQTSDEWILQRTGISERRICDLSKEGTFTLARDALAKALKSANMQGSELDMIIVATVSSEMPCPATASRVADAVGATPAGAFDLVAACSGFVYAMNLADSIIRMGRARAIGVIGVEVLSRVVDYTDRRLSILFGDGAGAAVLKRDDNPALGCIHQISSGDGSAWQTLYIPLRQQDIPEFDRDNPIRMGCMRMNGNAVFKFAVNKFRDVIEECFRETGLKHEDFSQIICHQSNLRIIDAAREKLGIPAEKMHINIDKYGNTSAASVAISLDELWREGKITAGKPLLLVAFGGGLTWASSVWQT